MTAAAWKNRLGGMPVYCRGSKASPSGSYSSKGGLVLRVAPPKKSTRPSPRWMAAWPSRGAAMVLWSLSKSPTDSPPGSNLTAVRSASVKSVPPPTTSTFPSPMWVAEWNTRPSGSGFSIQMCSRGR
jgi:hypothetical protein